MNEADMHGTLVAAKNEGRNEEKCQIAKALLKQGLSANQTAEATGLAAEDIESLSKANTSL